MCQSCIDIDKRIDEHRKALRTATNASEVDRINRHIGQLFADRVLLHQNPERYTDEK